MSETLEKDLGLGPVRLEDIQKVRALPEKERADMIVQLFNVGAFHALVSEVLADEKNRPAFLAALEQAKIWAEAKLKQPQTPVRRAAERFKQFLHKTFSGTHGNRDFFLGTAPGPRALKEIRDFYDRLQCDERAADEATRR